jgi:integrase
MFTLNNDKGLNTLLDEYLDYLTNRAQVKENVLNRYYSDIRYYFFNVIFKKSGFKSYFSFFDYSYIEELYEMRTGDTVPAAINQFLDFMEYKKKIDRVEYLNIRDMLGELRPIRKKKDITFLLDSDISFLFSEKVRYQFSEHRERDYSEYKYMAPLIWSLAYDCGLEQKHILTLLISDFDIANYKMRNLRKDKNPLLSDTIDISARTFNYLQKYLASRSANKSDNLLLIRNNPIVMADINKTFEILKRKENQKELSQTISIELLVRSGILKSLLMTHGNSLLGYLMVHGTESNGQLVHAIKAFQAINKRIESSDVGNLM